MIGQTCEHSKPKLPPVTRKPFGKKVRKSADIRFYDLASANSGSGKGAAFLRTHDCACHVIKCVVLKPFFMGARPLRLSTPQCRRAHGYSRLGLRRDRALAQDALRGNPKINPARQLAGDEAYQGPCN